MRITATSDIHGSQPNIPASTDVVVMAGDLTAYGKTKDIARFDKWVRHLAGPFTVVIVAGNHDWDFENRTPFVERIKDEWAALGNVHYLEDSGVTIDGVKFWGSPWRASPRGSTTSRTATSITSRCNRRSR